MPAPATADAAAEVSTTLNKASEADRAQSRAGAAPPAGRDLAAPAKPAVDEERARQLDAPIELQRSDAFVLAVVAVREAVARGDTTTALRLANALEHDFPGREIPKDVQALLDAAR
jgi:hypothetical protein